MSQQASKGKQVATTLKNVLNHPVMSSIIDRTSPVTEDQINKVTGWYNYDLYKRKPAPAYIDDSGKVMTTDLDLATFLYALADRGAVINLPKYKSSRASSTREGQSVVSNENRHGQLLSLTANKKTFSFGIKIMDMNVMTTDKVGDFRNFSITNLSGNFYSGWDRINFMPTAKENDFINETGIATGNAINFSNFVHPNRWTAFYSYKYFVTKALIHRLSEESKFIQGKITAMLDAGVTYPESGEGAQKDWPKTTRGESKGIKVDCMEVEVDVPWEGEFTDQPPMLNNRSNLIHLTDLRRTYLQKVISKLRFATRATELAMYNKVRDSSLEPFPAWIDNAKWEREYRAKKGGSKWDRLVLFQPGVGQRGVAIRKRRFLKTEQVSLDYNEK